jgi:hypothetical protein
MRFDENAENNQCEDGQLALLIGENRSREVYQRRPIVWLCILAGDTD